jgi:hypothetical protein
VLRYIRFNLTPSTHLPLVATWLTAVT